MNITYYMNKLQEHRPGWSWVLRAGNEREGRKGMFFCNLYNADAIPIVGRPFPEGESFTAWALSPTKAFEVAISALIKNGATSQ